MALGTGRSKRELVLLAVAVARVSNLPQLAWLLNIPMRAHQTWSLPVLGFHCLPILMTKLMAFGNVS